MTDSLPRASPYLHQQAFNPYFPATGTGPSDKPVSYFPAMLSPQSDANRKPKSSPLLPRQEVAAFGPQATKHHGGGRQQDDSDSSATSSPASSSDDAPLGVSSGSIGGTGAARPATSSSGSQGSDDGEDDENGSRRTTSSNDCDDYGGSDSDSDDAESNEESSESADDDVPLAKALPDALKAQKSLRMKEREELSKKRGKSGAGGTPTKRGSPSKVRSNPVAIKPMHGLPPGAAPPLSASSSPVARSFSTRAPAPSQPRPQPRKQATMPAPARNPFGFARDELSKKDKGAQPGQERGRAASIKSEPKRPDSGGARPHNLLLPQTDEHVQRRNRSKGRSERDLAPPLAPFVQDSVLTMSEGSDDDDDLPLQPLAGSTTAKLRAAKSVHKPVSPKGHAPSPTLAGLKINDAVRAHSVAQPASADTSASSHPSAVGPADLAHMQRPAYHSKQRIYVNDPQHHATFDIDEKTTPATILAQLRAKNAISANPAYAVVEMWRQLGVERPLREYEYLQDSIQSWGNEVNASLFLVKKSDLSGLLTSATSPAAESETFGGWVQMELKRGKWSKRWLEIRNQSVFCGKSEKVRLLDCYAWQSARATQTNVHIATKPRDQSLLCTLSSFDAYQIPQACIVKLKTPKPFAFALKSVDKITLFENADQDYVHFFSVKTEAERDSWIHRILNTRTTIVKQLLAARASAQTVDTRSNLLSQPMAYQNSASSATSAHTTASTAGPPSSSGQSSGGLSRANSRYQAGPPVSNTSPPMPSNAVFADGSLLARATSVRQQPGSGPTSPTSAYPPPVPPMPGQIAAGSFQTIPQGRDWERLGHEERQRHIHEAAKKAREGGKTLLDFGDQHQQPPMSRNRSKSISQRR